MKNIVATTLKSVKKSLNPNNSKYCFEIFGFDLFMDISFNLWLIEVNTNPCLEESCPLLSTLLPRMIDDAFKLTIDVIFPMKNFKNKKSPYWVPEYNDEENMFEMLC